MTRRLEKVKRKLAGAGRRARQAAGKHPWASSFLLVGYIILSVIAVSLALAPRVTVEPDTTMLGLLLVVAGLIFTPLLNAIKSEGRITPGESPILIVAGTLGLTLLLVVLVMGGILQDGVIAAATLMPFGAVGLALLALTFLGLASLLGGGGNGRSGR